MKLKQLTLASIFIALGVALSSFSIPIGASKCFPIQHFINVAAGMILGPIPALLCAFCTSLIRNIMGTGTLLAFPGSMIGAFLCGTIYRYSCNVWAGCAGEIVGTSIIGAICSYPIAFWLLRNHEVAIFAYIIPFGISSVVGSIIGSCLMYKLSKSGILLKLKDSKEKSNDEEII